jgi:hypothetical protein
VGGSLRSGCGDEMKDRDDERQAKLLEIHYEIIYFIQHAFWDYGVGGRVKWEGKRSRNSYWKSG